MSGRQVTAVSRERTGLICQGTRVICNFSNECATLDCLCNYLLLKGNIWFVGGIASSFDKLNIKLGTVCLGA